MRALCMLLRVNGVLVAYFLNFFSVRRFAAI